MPQWTCLAANEPQAAMARTDGVRPASFRQRLWKRIVERRSLYRLAKGAARLLRGVRRASDIIRMQHDGTYAERVYWRMNPKFSQILETARGQQVDFWLANDWTTLPIARRLAAEQGVPYGYDTHELAVEEYAQSRLWVFGQRPIIVSVESAGIRDAAFVTCVSDGIADRLAEVYGLSARPTVIRNMPMYSPQPFHACGDMVEVLYHGAVCAGRGLEACIRSVALWRPEFRLTIRGPSTTDYLARLRAECVAAGVEGRVVFDEPVPMTQMVARANGFDVGLFALPDHSLQNVHVLPNKFFEYTMAGLALCVSDLPEMTRLLRRYDLGELIAAVTPEAIADAVNRMDQAAIDRFKRHALEAAKELNWQAEGLKLLDACQASLARRGTLTP
jgi:glycosyltransferase involved in cell wall biosynthesis